MKMQTIELDHGTLKVQTKAYVFGEWAAHRVPHIIGRIGWRVSHAPTGIGTSVLCDELDRADAIAVARLLSDRIPRLKLLPTKAVRPGIAPFFLLRDDSQIIRATFGEVLGG